MSKKIFKKRKKLFDDCLQLIVCKSPVYCFEIGKLIKPGESCLVIPKYNIYFCDGSLEYQSFMEMMDFINFIDKSA